MSRIKIVLKYIRILILQILSIGIVFHMFNLIVTPSQIDPQAQEYYDEFLAEADSHDQTFVKYLKVTIVVEPLANDKQLGNCRSFLGLQPKIILNSNKWSSLNPIEKEMVVFHELAHCLLLKGHGLEHQPDTLMSKSLFNHNHYIQNREYFLAEIFDYKTYHVPNFVVTFFNLEKPSQMMGYPLKP